MPMKACLTCHEAQRDGSRCKPCAKAFDEERYGRRGSPASRGYDRHWRKLRAAAIARHLAAYGPVCPGYGCPPHVVAEQQLTLDHVLPRIAGGLSVAENAAVLCRGCNSRKGAGERRGVGAIR